MKRACWILFASACVVGFYLPPWHLHPRAALMLEDLTICLLGVYLGLILAHMFPLR
jgi:hypothetical protein